MRSNSRNTLLGVALLALAAAAANPAVADDDDRVKMDALVRAGKFITPDEAKEKAVAAKPGEVIDIDLDRSWRGSYSYEIEIVDADINEWEVHVDAKTGKVQSVQRDWFD